MKKILLFTTGGTIASKEGTNGLEPEMDADELLSYMGDLTSRYDITCRELLNLDSSNIQAEEWRTIARNVFENTDSYDGIVITHGTDTMAYTASALSFMLQNPPIPIVLTGSQMPIDNMLTDARNNLYTAFAAIDAGIPGVSVAFNRRVMRGCRAVKVRTLGFEAFESVNAPYLAEVFANGMRCYHGEDVPSVQTRGKTPVLKDQVCTDVFLLKLIPNTNPAIFDMIPKLGYRGLVLEAFGAGGLHFVRRKLLECGIIPGHDMTTEAAVTKLMWTLGQTGDPEEVKRIFRTNIAGEISLTEADMGP